MYNLSANLVRNNKTTKELVSKDIKTYQIDELYPLLEGSSHLTLGCRAADYSPARIAVAVEDCGALLFNLNVMQDESGVYDLLVDIRINRLNTESVARSLQRYGYDVVGFSSDGDSIYESTLRDRVNEVLRYINI